MPTGSYTLSDVKAERVVLECAQCNRRGSYSTERLIQQHGPDITLPDLKNMLVKCRTSEAAGLEGCKARYSDETVRSWLGK